MSIKQAEKRNLTLFTLSEFIGTIGSNIYVFGLALYVLALSGSATGFAILLISSSIARIISSPIAGHIIDRYPRRTVILTAHTLSTVILTTVLIITHLYTFSLPIIYTTAFVLAITSTFAGLGLTAAVPNLVSENNIQRALTLTQSSTSIAVILGPVAGGILYGFLSIQTFLLINTIAYATVTLIETQLNFRLFTKPSEETTQPKQPIAQSLKQGLNYLWHNPTLKSIALVALWINFFYTGIIVGMPYMLIQLLSITPAQFGIIEAMLAVGTLITAIYLSTQKELKHPIKTIRTTMALLGIIVAGLSLPFLLNIQGPALIAFYITTALLIGTTIVIINTPISVILQKTTPDHLRGRVFALLETAAMGITPIGMALFGLLYDTLPPIPILTLIGTMLIIIPLIGLRTPPPHPLHHNKHKQKPLSHTQQGLTLIATPKALDL